jgi:hypothetical protein
MCWVYLRNLSQQQREHYRLSLPYQSIHRRELSTTKQGSHLYDRFVTSSVERKCIEHQQNNLFQGLTQCDKAPGDSRESPFSQLNEPNLRISIDDPAAPDGSYTSQNIPCNRDQIAEIQSERSLATYERVFTARKHHRYTNQVAAVHR